MPIEGRHMWVHPDKIEDIHTERFHQGQRRPVFVDGLITDLREMNVLGDEDVEILPTRQKSRKLLHGYEITEARLCYHTGTRNDVFGRVVFVRPEQEIDAAVLESEKFKSGDLPWFLMGSRG